MVYLSKQQFRFEIPNVQGVWRQFYSSCLLVEHFVRSPLYLTNTWGHKYYILSWSCTLALKMTKEVHSCGNQQFCVISPNSVCGCGRIALKKQKFNLQPVRTCNNKSNRWREVARSICHAYLWNSPECQ